MTLRERMQERSAPLVKRAATFVKEWEWTWTRAVIACLVLWFIAIGTLAIIPSFWLYFADQKLGWRPCPCKDTVHFFLFKLRDVVASGLFGTPFLAFIVVPLLLQKWRQKLRGESGVTRPTGGYR